MPEIILRQRRQVGGFRGKELREWPVTPAADTVHDRHEIRYSSDSNVPASAYALLERDSVSPTAKPVIVTVRAIDLILIITHSLNTLINKIRFCTAL